MVGRYIGILVNPFQFFLGGLGASSGHPFLSEGFVNFLLGYPQIRKPGLRFRQFSVNTPWGYPKFGNQGSSFVNFLIVKLSLISGFVTHFWVNDSFLGCTVSNRAIFIAMFDN